MKFAATTIVTATILTLAVTAFFYVVTPEAPLGGGAIAVVAGFWLLVISIIRLVWSLIRRKEGKK